MLNRILMAAVGTVAVAGLGYVATRKFKKDSPEELAVVAKEAIKPISKLQEVFEHDFNVIAEMVQYDPKWANGTGYFNGAMDVKLEKGHVAKSIDQHGRRIILVGTEHRTAVLFERYTAGRGAFVIVHNSDSALRNDLPNGNLDLETYQAFISKAIESRANA